MQPDNLTLADGTVLDPQVLKMTRAIRQVESQGNYNAVGDNGESHGAYQFNKDNFKNWAPEYGIDPNDMSPGNQNKVAYMKMKALKDKGLSPDEIAATWNGGHTDTSTGKFTYNNPDYGKKFHAALLNTSPIAGGQSTAIVPTSPSSEVQSEEPTKSFGGKVLGFLGTITETKSAGEDIGEALAAGGNIQLYKDNMKLWQEVAEKIATRINQMKADGQDTTRLMKAFKYHMDAMPKASDFVPNAVDKTPEQIFGDFGQLALSIGTAGSLSNIPSSVAGRVATAGAVGAGFGATGAMGENASTEDIAKQAALGGVVGAATGGLFEAGGAVVRGVRNALTRKTTQEITQAAATEMEPQAERAFLKSLNNEDRVVYYKAKATGAQNEARNVLENNTKKLSEDISKIESEIQTAGEQVGSKLTAQAEALKPKAQQLLKDMSSENGPYIQAIERGSTGAGMQNKQVGGAFVNDIEARFGEHDPQLAAMIKDQMNLNSEGGKILPSVTNQEKYDFAKSLYATLSKGVKGKTSVFSKEDFDKMKIYSFIMENLGENGVNMTEANNIWKNWATLRQQIVTKVNPWDIAGTKRAPIVNLMKTAFSKATTVTQINAKNYAQHFIGEIEKAIEQSVGLGEGSLKGSIGTEVKEAISKLDEATQKKINIKEVADAVSKRIKTELKDTLTNVGKPGSIAYQKAEAASIARHKTKINKIILKSLAALGITVLGAKAIPHVVGAVMP